MRRLILPALLGGGTMIAAATAFAGNGDPIDTGSKNALTLAVYGDAPYGTTPTDTSELEATPAFIESINDDPKVDLVLHVGDIHSGKQYCTAAYDAQVFDLWQIPLEWLRLTVDPQANAPQGSNAFGPFSWVRVTQ